MALVDFLLIVKYGVLQNDQNVSYINIRYIIFSSKRFDLFQDGQLLRKWHTFDNFFYIFFLIQIFLLTQADTVSVIKFLIWGITLISTSKR